MPLQNSPVSSLFQSTPSARRATVIDTTANAPADISIHALREEGDKQQQCNYRPKRNFNPRPPRGGRQGAHALLYLSRRFQSTPSARRATQFQDCYHVVIDISIHALREEGDLFFGEVMLEAKNFNPRPPRGGRLCSISSNRHKV